MATIDVYKIKIEVDGDQDIKKVQQNIDELSTTLGNAGKAIAGFGLAATAAFAGLATSAVQLADELVDVAEGLGLTVGRVYQVGLAAERSGGQFESAGKMLQKLALSIDMAAKGSQDMQDDFAKAGVSLQDLATLSDEALFDKVVQGIANMGSSADSTAVAMKLLGKSAATIKFDTFVNEFKLSAAEAAEAEKAMYLTADAVGALEIVFRRFQIAALQVLTPILKQVRELKIDTDTVATAFQTLGTIIAAAIGATVAARIVTIITAVVQLTKALRAAAVAGAILQGVTGIGLAKVIGGLVGAGGAIYMMNQLFDESGENVQAMTGEIEKAADAEGKIVKAREIQAGQDQIALKTAQEKTNQLRLQIDQANKLRQQTISLIGVEANYANLQKANLQAEIEAEKQIGDLQALINQELAKGTTTSAKIVQQYQLQQDVIRNNLSLIKELNQEEYFRLQVQKNLATLTDSIAAKTEQMGKRAIDANEEQLMEKLILGQITQDQLNREQELFTAKQNNATTMALLQQKLDDATADNDAEEIRRINDLMDREKMRFRDEMTHLNTKHAHAELLQQSAVAGAIAGMEQLKASMEPYQLAQDAILQTWGTIGSALDNFVETGKFKFKDLAKSIIQDLTKMILKAMIFKYIFEPLMGAFGLSIPGRANGGPVGAGEAYMVGERGPELFVPRSAGSIIPNNKLGGASAGPGVVNAPVTNNYITNQISAVDAKSVAQLFAENRKTLLGTVQMAQKEMPYSMA